MGAVPLALAPFLRCKMGGKSSRSKGQRGEREICKILGDALGISLNRELDQTRDGGCDIIINDFWAVEVKFQECNFKWSWWDQACKQALDNDKHPVLIYRKSNQDWKVVMPYSLDKPPESFFVFGDLALFIERAKDD
jgi:hypothetical protein